MSDTSYNTEPTPVEASNASAALPGASTPAGGALAASGTQDAASTAAAAPPPTSEPYSTMTTPTAVGVPTTRSRTLTEARTKDDEVEEETGPAVIPQNMSAYTDPYSPTGRELPPNQAVAIQNEAARLGIAPSTLAAVIDKETGAKFDPNIIGGTNNRYRGLIQMGPTERRDYGWRDGMTFEEQLAGPAHNYLVDRGVKPGMGVDKVYSIINAGSLTKRGNPRWNASDGYNPDGTRRTVRGHVEDINANRLPKYTYLDQGAAPTVTVGEPGSTMVAANVPEPRLRPETGASVPALAFAEETGAATVEPVSLVLSTNAVEAAVLDKGRVVERGAKGEPVRELQTFLAMHGFTDASGRQVTIDGDFGPRTKEAVKAYQEWSEIEVDGRVGPETVRSILYTIDPTVGPASDGKVAYDDGAAAAGKIIDPARFDDAFGVEVDMPSPRLRPVPEPRMRLGTRTKDDAVTKPADLTEAEIDELTRVDEAGNYIVAPARRLPTEGLASEPGKVTETMRAEAYANLEWYRRQEAATKAGEQATRQRLSEARTKDDRFRPRARPMDTRSQDDVMLIRSSEAVREFSRAVADQYREVIHRKTYAPALQESERITEAEHKVIADDLLRANPTPAETVTETYSFGRPPATGFIGPDFGAFGRAKRPSLYEEMRKRFGPNVTYTPPMS